MEETIKKRLLPKSRKALEYRVFWLERKLSFLKESDKRKENSSKIAKMPDSPIKELMHLNDEFQRANQKAESLKDLTEELNQDALRINERSERMNELTVGKITDAERLNRQTRRVQKRSRLLNQDLLKSQKASKDTNDKSLAINAESQSHIDESKYLSKLTRAQHLATDKLNQKTRALSVEALQITAGGIKLNRQLDTSNKESQALNLQLEELSKELEQTKTALNLTIEESIEINDKGIVQLAKLEDAEESAIIATDLSEQSTSKAEAQYKQSDDLKNDSINLNKQSSANIKEFANLEKKLIVSIDDNDAQHDALRETLTRDIAVLELDSITKLKGFTDYHGDIIKVELRDAIEETKRKLKTTLETNKTDTDRLKQETQNYISVKTESIIDTFRVRSSSSLSKFEDEAEKLSHSLSTNLVQSQDFLDKTAALNDTTNRVTQEGLELNVESMALQKQCNEAMTDIDTALVEIDNIKSKLSNDTLALQSQSEELNAESKFLIKTGTEINAQSLEIQKEGFNTQSLSQEINNHSLALHQEIRVINQDFDRVNERNQTLVQELHNLKNDMENLYQKNQNQIDQTRTTNATGSRLNEETNKLNTEANFLTEQMVSTLQNARTALAESETLNINSVAVAQEIRNKISNLDLARSDIEESSADTRIAAAEARQVMSDTLNLQENLETSATEFKTLMDRAGSELDSLEVLKQENVDLTKDSRDAYLQLKNCIGQSQQINDDFMRGLEATSHAQKASEEKADTLLEETKVLQTDIRDMLSLRTGVQEFQKNIDDCQEKLVEYASDLNHCKQSTSTHSDMLKDYQTRIELYQGELESYRSSVSQFDVRARGIENQFSSQANKIKEIEGQQDKQQTLHTNQYLLQMRELEAEIGAALRANKTSLQEDIESISLNMKSSFERLLEDTKLELKTELDSRFRDQDEKIRNHKETLGTLSTEFHGLNEGVVDEINTLREESLEMRNQNREFLQQQRTFQREQNRKTEQHRSELDDVSHKLVNYKTLIEDKLDNQDDLVLKNRLSSLELNIKNQHSMITDQNARRNIDNSSVDELSGMVMEFSNSLQEVLESNRSLKVAIEDSEKRNRQLSKQNTSLKNTMQEREVSMQAYSDRLLAVEQRESINQDTLSQFKNTEVATKQTLQQMRHAMKDSTKAMRETQETLLGFKSSFRPQSNEKVTDRKPAAQKDKNTWLADSRQAVLSSLFAMFITSMALMGLDNVDSVDASMTAATSYAASNAASTNNQIPVLEIPGVKNPAQIKEARSPSLPYTWPVNVDQLSPNAIDYKAHHQGINILAELGDPVLAINDGTVIYSAKEIRGYGNVIVIQHENELLSVYANNQFNYVNEGDSVERGQLIGDIGQLFNQDKAGLYFEIRYMGTPEDPFNYLNQSPLIQNAKLVSVR